MTDVTKFEGWLAELEAKAREARAKRDRLAIELRAEINKDITHPNGRLLDRQGELNKALAEAGREIKYDKHVTSMRRQSPAGPRPGQIYGDEGERGRVGGIAERPAVRGQRPACTARRSTTNGRPGGHISKVTLTFTRSRKMRGFAIEFATST